MAKKLNNALPEKVLLLMQHRRDKILASATDLLSSSDNAAFSLRKLAAAADVTVPTIYNLVGGKTEILLALQTRLVEDTEKGLQLLGDEHILDIVDLIISGSIDSIATNEAYYRGAMLAMNELRQVEGGSPEYVAFFNRATAMPIGALRKAQKLNLMRGDIDPNLLSTQIFRQYSAALSEWMYRQINLEQFRHRALTSAYICLLSDAGDTLRKDIIARM